MGKLEKRADQFSGGSMPPELPERIRFNFHQRYSRRKNYHLAICSVMMVFGLWLVSPVFIILFDHLAFPSIGFSIVDNLSNAVMDITNLLMMVWNGVVNFQGILLGTLSISVLIGMICLGAGAIWGIAYFIPLRTVQYGD